MKLWVLKTVEGLVFPSVKTFNKWAAAILVEYLWNFITL